MTDAPAQPVASAYVRTCPGCGKPFETPFPDKVTCSPRCRQRERNARKRAAWKGETVAAQAVMAEALPARLTGLPPAVKRYARTKMTVAERIEGYQELHARLLNSLTDDVLDEMGGRDRIIALGILEDKLEKLEARPAAPVRGKDREAVMRLLARLEEERRRRAGAIDAAATEVRS